MRNKLEMHVFLPSAVKMCVAGGAGLSLWVSSTFPQVNMQMERIPASHEAVRAWYQNLKRVFEVLFV